MFVLRLLLGRPGNRVVRGQGELLGGIFPLPYQCKPEEVSNSSGWLWLPDWAERENEWQVEA